MQKKTIRQQSPQMKEQMNHEFLMMTPAALDALRDMITDPEINPIARVQAIGLILDRGLGKPEENIRIQNTEENVESALERLDEVFGNLTKAGDGEK